MMPHIRTAASVLALTASAAASAQSVTNCSVGIHASNVPGPVIMGFASDGTLYCGRDTIASGSMTPQFVTRIGPGGAPIGPFGVAPTPDPDPAVVDELGFVSGVPGSVLSGGYKGSNSLASISAIRPDQSVVELWESAAWINVQEMKFDAAGRLYFLAMESRSIWRSVAGEPPTILATLPVGSNPVYLAIASDGRLFASDSVGRIRAYSAEGVLLNDNVATFPSTVAIEFGIGSGFGTDLYALRITTGTLHRIAANGMVTQIGTGFGGSPKDLAVGPDGRLYVSQFTSQTIRSITPLGCACNAFVPADLDCNGSVGAADLAILLGAWGTKNCAADLDQNGVVGASDLAILLGAWGG